MSITPFIKRLETASQLSREEQQALRELPVREVDIKADQEVVREGDQPTRICFIISGMACTSKMVAGDRRQILNFHLIGDAPDLLSLHLDVIDLTISTITPSRLGFVTHGAVRQLCSRFPRIADALWRHTLVDGAIFRAWLANIGQKSARARVSHLFCEMFLRSEAMGLASGGRIAFPITQAEMGDAVGLSVVHINRVVQELRTEGLISLEEGTLEILDWQALQGEADFHPDYLHIKQKAALAHSDA